MNRLLPTLALLSLGGVLALPILPGSLGAEEFFPRLDEPLRRSLLAGEAVKLPKRPDEGDSVDHRYVTIAKLVKGSRNLIWEVINDKKNAADFMSGILESTVVEAKGNIIVVDQLTEVGGPKGSYRYRLQHTLTPKRFALFSYLGGEIRDVSGGWWIFDGPDPERHLVVYSLHIDPGRFAPQAVVKRGQQTSMPQAIESVRAEVSRRAAR